MFAAMARARDHINLETYILDAGEIGERLAALLAKKVDEGVKVQPAVRQRRLDQDAAGVTSSSCATSAWRYASSIP